MNKNSKVIKQKKVEKKENRKAAKIIRNILLAIILIVIVAASVFGIHEWKVIKELDKRTTFAEDDAGKIGGESVSMAEFMLYSIDVKNGYESQYGSDIWSEVTTDANGDEDSFENVAKEDTFEQIRFTRALLKEGKNKKISLTDEEKEAMKSSAKDYYKTLTDAGVDEDVVTLSDIEKFYENNYYAQKVYYNITGINNYSSGTLSLKESSTENVDSSETSQFTTEDMQKLWKRLIKKYYPDFDYEIDINWENINQISFASENQNSTEEPDTASEEEITETEN